MPATRTASELARAQFARADNMTDSLAALRAARRDRHRPTARRRWPASTSAGSTSRWWSTSGSRSRPMIEDDGRGRAGRGPAGAPGLHLDQPQPGPRGAGVVRDGEPAGLPPPRRRRLPAARRQGAGARPPQPAGRRPHAGRRSAAGAASTRTRQALMRGRAGARRGGCRAVARRLRDRQQEPGAVDRGAGRRAA